MKRSRKSHRVSWASGVDLCQVKLFSTEDSPSKISMQAQVHPKRNSSYMLQRLTVHETVGFPPGFGSILRLKEEASRIPRTEWRCPPNFVVSREWHVAAGEESLEKKAQNRRDLGVLEAVYPRLSAIPHSPSVSREVEVEHWNDSLTPVVPLTPIEEEEAADVPSDSVEPRNASTCPLSSELSQSSVKLYSSKTHNPVPNSPMNQNPLLPDFGADLVTAALTAVLKSKERGSLIDTNLLVEILSDPELIEKLITDSQAPASAISLPMPALKPDSIPLVCSKLSAPVAPTAANDKFNDVHGEALTIAKPGMTSAIHVAGPTMLLNSNPSNGSSEHLHSDLKPNRVSTQLYTTPPVSELKQVAPSFPIPSRPAVGNLHAKPSLVQPTLSSMPTQPHAVPKSSPLPLKPNSVPSQMLPLSNLMHTQPSAVPKSSLPSKPNSLPSQMPPLSNLMQTQPNGVFQPPLAAMKINPVKDVNYIKNLIREHGAAKQDKRDLTMSQNGTHYNLHIQNMEMTQNIKMGEAKPKCQKPCAYFMSSTGCRNGSNCPYQHDLPFQWQTGSIMHAPSAKRMKFGGEIAGR